MQVAHHDQQVDDSLRRLDAEVAELHDIAVLNSEARVRSNELLRQHGDEMQDLNSKVDGIRQIMMENRVLLKKHDAREMRDHESQP